MQSTKELTKMEKAGAIKITNLLHSRNIGNMSEDDIEEVIYIASEALGGKNYSEFSLTVKALLTHRSEEYKASLFEEARREFEKVDISEFIK